MEQLSVLGVAPEQIMSKSALPKPSEPGPSLVAGAYQALKSAILETVFPPGYHASEQEIALRLNMSRTPVHEALIRLQEEGLVAILPKRGILVCALSPDDMREVYDIIISLEGTAAEIIAAKDAAARRAVAAELESFNEKMEAALADDDLAAWAKADDGFHRTLIGSCGNARLARLANTIMDQSHRARMMTLRLRAKPVASIKDHKAIIAAIRTGKPDAALAKARDHRRRAGGELLPLLQKLGMTHL